MEFKPSDPQTIGIELELQLLESETLDLADGILPLLKVYPGSLYVKPEFIQNTVEIASKVCTSIPELEAHVMSLAAGLNAKCRELGMSLCGAGSHPFSERLALITPLPRYRAIEQRYRYLSHTQITFATHVHIGMTSGDEAIAMMRALKPYLPLLIAISANSPFWRGFDTGFASYRHRILAATRSYGVPPSFESWRDFCAFFDATRRAGLFGSVNDIHWDIRPRPNWGTLEVRAMDAQSGVEEAVALASFVRVLVALLRDAGRVPPAIELPRPLPWWIEKENHFEASRRGLAAHYIADEHGAVKPLAQVWRDVVQALRPVAENMGEREYVESLCGAVESGVGYTRQREIYRRTGSLKEVVAQLVQRFATGIATAVSPGAANAS